MSGDGVDVEAAARELVVDLMVEPRGQVSPSVYETGRVVTHAPWLVGHAARLRYLAATQRPDGGWGGPGGYALAPTLSAVEALLATLRRYGAGAERVVPPDRLRKAADRGLAMLADRARGRDPLSTPDMPAVDLIVPALTRAVNGHLARLENEPLEGLDQWVGRRLALPSGMDHRRLDAVRALLGGGGRVPTKLLHALEVAPDLAARAAGISALPFGTIGASPAATAAWLGTVTPPDPYDPARRYLEGVARQHRGPVPCAAPIAVFERAWALGWLAQAGVPMTVPDTLLMSLRAATHAGGTPAGPGLPSDADTTSVALYTLGLLGVRCEPHSLWAYETDSHFCTWQGEDGESVTVNAHVLEAFGHYLAMGGPGAVPRPRGAVRRYEAAVGKLTRWLCERQQSDGRWLDRWHASPYYATACCALALDRFGVGHAAAAAVDRAVEWVLNTQHADGSYGWRNGTAEETAYAMRILLTRFSATADHAVRRAYSYLRGSIRARTARRLTDPAQWHDKDLYLPVLIVRSAVLAALYQAQRRLGADALRKMSDVDNGEGLRGDSARC
jgi:halimadienyl-diphosphate synthase